MAVHQAPTADRTGVDSFPMAPPVRWAEPSPWPPQALQTFSIRMAGHGLCVSGTLMNHDRRYALEQLRHAHTLADAALRELAVELFRHFERRQSGLGFVN